MACTHLHVHSEYSLLDGACRIGEMVARAKELGQTSLAITDHGVMYGAVAFFKECQAQGIHPIIGCEVYVAPRNMSDRVYGVDNEYTHLILLCKNETGYHNLCYIVSMAFTEGFYVKPRKGPTSGTGKRKGRPTVPHSTFASKQTHPTDTEPPASGYPDRGRIKAQCDIHQ